MNRPNETSKRSLSLKLVILSVCFVCVSTKASDLHRSECAGHAGVDSAVVIETAIGTAIGEAVDKSSKEASVGKRNAALSREREKKTIAIGKRNAALTKARENQNVNLAGCELLKQNAEASCYGNSLKGGATLIGPFDPYGMTAAYPDRSQRGNILVVRVPGKNISRAITITDIGPTKEVRARKKNRAIDLSAGVFAAFGLRCNTIMTNLEIYQCPGR